MATSSGRVQGLTVQIGGDTTKLDKALKSTNKEIKNTQTSLKDVEKLLKLDPTNTELLAQKQQLLKNRVEETTKKLETLKDAEKQLKESGIDQNSEQFMGLRREIIDTESALKSATKESNSFNVGLEKTKATLGEIGNAAGKIGDKFSTISQKTAGLSTAAAGVVASLTGAAYGAATNADDLNTLAKQTGISTEELQKFSYASDLVDVASEDITSALKRMKRNMDSTSTDVQEAWQAIGVSVTDESGNFRDSTEVFYDVLLGLSKIENETQRDIVAMQIFGKNADSLAGIIDDGGAALKKIGAEAENLGLVLDQETLDSLNAVNDEIDTLKMKANGTIATTGAKALEALQPVFDIVIEKLGELLEFIGSLDADTLKVIVTIATVIAAISPIAGIIGTIGKAISVLSANPIMLIIAAVVALATAIIANWDKIKPVLDKIKAKVVEVINNIRDKVKAGINKIIGWINNAIEAINTLIRGVNKIGSAIGFEKGIPEIGSIPMLARGGSLTSGSAIVGEAGAELLTVNSGRATVTPLNANSNIESMLGQISGQLGSSNPIQLTVYSVLDGRVVGRSTQSYNMQRQMMYGG